MAPVNFLIQSTCVFVAVDLTLLSLGGCHPPRSRAKEIGKRIQPCLSRRCFSASGVIFSSVVRRAGNLLHMWQCGAYRVVSQKYAFPFAFFSSSMMRPSRKCYIYASARLADYTLLGDHCH
jgi:hypothetical protein